MVAHVTARFRSRYAAPVLLLVTVILAGPAASAASASTAPPPAGLAAVAGGGSEVDLSWSAPAAPGLTVTGYDIFEGASPGGEPATPVNGFPVTGTSDPVTGLAAATTYYFTVTALYQICPTTGRCGTYESSPSNEASATTSPALPPPTGLAAVAAGGSEVDLSWSAPAAPGLTVTGYDIFEGTSPGGESTDPVSASPVTGTSDPVTGLAAATTYYFTVTALYYAGQSPPSGEAHVATSGGTGGTGGRMPQTISFRPLPSRAADVTFAVAASASSGLPVTLGSGTPKTCAVTGFTVRTRAAGRCVIRATQGGDTRYRPAAAATRWFTISARQRPPAGRTSLAVWTVIILTGLAAALCAVRRWLRARRAARLSARVLAKPYPGHAVTTTVRVTGTEATQPVSIEPHGGPTSTQIEEVRS